MTSSDRHCTRGAFLAVAATFALLTLAACGGGGGGGGGPQSMMPPGGDGGTGSGTPPGSNAAYTVSADGGTFGSLPVTVSADAITVVNQTIRLYAASQVGTQAGHYRAFDSAGATSGPATEVHYFGQRDGYNYLQFGSWARGVVSPNPGFRIGEQFGAFLAPTTGSSPTPTSNLPVTGTAQWQGSYAGYVDKAGVGRSQVIGPAVIDVFFNSARTDYDAVVLVQLSWPDPARSSFAATPTFGGTYNELVQIDGVLKGNTFESDLTATYTVAGQTLPRGDRISVTDYSGCGSNCLYSHGLANAGGMTGGIYGNRGGEAGGTYWFAIGTTRAAGSFGGKLQ